MAFGGGVLGVGQMKTMECSDHALMTTARVLVEKSRLDPTCTSFADVIARAESSPWPGLAMNPEQRKRFRAMMNGIWLGQGDSLNNADDVHDLLRGHPSHPDLVN